MQNTLENTSDLNNRTAKHLTKLLKADVRWLIESRGVEAFDPNTGPEPCGSNAWRIKPGNCATCIVGAHLIHTGATCEGEDTEPYKAFARVQRITDRQAAAIYFGAILSRNYEDLPRACLVAADVLTYALDLGWTGNISAAVTPEKIALYRDEMIRSVRGREPGKIT